MQVDLGEFEEFMRASKPRRVRVVLGQEEVGRLLAAMEGSCD